MKPACSQRQRLGEVAEIRVTSAGQLSLVKKRKVEFTTKFSFGNVSPVTEADQGTADQYIFCRRHFAKPRC